jgi:GNAT superfamily N-acetyltransferase
MSTTARLDQAEITLRPHRPGDIGWVISEHGALYAEEYGWDGTFEAFVAEIAARFIVQFDPAREHCWIAVRGTDRLGAVFCVKGEEPGVAKLRMLIVAREARGQGVGQMLVDACIAFARERSYTTLTLWTNDILIAARRIYEARGFRLVREDAHVSFGKALVGQYWELTL